MMKAPKSISELAREERRTMAAPPKRKAAPIAYVTEGQRQLCGIKAQGTTIARRIGVGKSAVTRWRQGQESPDPTHRQLLERHYGVPARMWELSPVVSASSNGKHSKGLENTKPESLERLPAGWTLQTLEKIMQRLDRRMQEPALTTAELGNLATRLHSFIALRSKLLGDSRSDEQKLLDSAAWQELVEHLRAALEPHPEALLAITERLERLGGSASPLSSTSRPAAAQP